MLAGETDGLAIDFAATSAESGSAAVKDTGTPANDFDGAPQDLLTYAGSSTKWVFNSSGVLVESPAGTLPIDHDPLTGARKGVLAEEQRTNLLLHSQAFDNAAWTKQASSVTADGTTAPDGTTTADQLSASGGDTNYFVYPVAQRNWTNVPHTLSAHAKAGTQNYLWLGAFDGTNAFGGVFNLSTGVYVGDRTGAAATTATIEDVGSGWYRCSITFNWRLGLPRLHPNLYRREAERHYQVLNQHLEGRSFIVGVTYTIADISAWGWLDRASRLRKGVDDPMGSFPNLKRLFEAVDSRPAVARARSSRAAARLKLPCSATSMAYRRYRRSRAMSDTAASCC
jgi:hypothetical protein